jgi:hypothetical protein
MTERGKEKEREVMGREEKVKRKKKERMGQTRNGLAVTGIARGACCAKPQPSRRKIFSF